MTQQDIRIVRPLRIPLALGAFWEVAPYLLCLGALLGSHLPGRQIDRQMWSIVPP